MSDSAVKRRKRYVDYPRDKSKTCLIHGPGNSSDDFKVLNGFVSKYAKIRPTKDPVHDPVPRKKFNKNQDNNSIVKISVDEILLRENEKVSSEKEAHEMF